VAGGSGMTCSLNSPKRPPYWNSTISPKSTCHSAPVCKILSKSDHPRQKKNDVMSILKMADISPCTTSYRSNHRFDTCILATDRQKDRQTDKQTDEQMDSIDVPSRSFCHERRFNNQLVQYRLAPIF